MFNRFLRLELPAGQSAFLWGARKTGKSTFLKQSFPQSKYYDLLNTDLQRQLITHPHTLRAELSALDHNYVQHPVIIDEVQKIPALLDEIHWLIENKKIGFILCGSSARKLKRGAANLLGGRAWQFNFYPLVYREIPQFDLLTALNCGLLPQHYQSGQPNREFRSYANMYLKEEIQAEGIVRNLPGFTRFLELVGFCHGEMLNYANIARDCSVDAKTVKEYFQILADTLIGYFVYPFCKKIKRDIIATTPKFYLFDVGIANYLAHKKIHILAGNDAGRAFESYIHMELVAYLGLTEQDLAINYWRSKSGLEVDFVTNNGNLAIEVKISANPVLSEIKGLSAFCDDYNPEHAIVVCHVPRPRKVQTKNGKTISILPWQLFLENLWLGKYVL